MRLWEERGRGRRMNEPRQENMLISNSRTPPPPRTLQHGNFPFSALLKSRAVNLEKHFLSLYGDFCLFTFVSCTVLTSLGVWRHRGDTGYCKLERDCWRNRTNRSWPPEDSERLYKPDIRMQKLLKNQRPFRVRRGTFRPTPGRAASLGHSGVQTTHVLRDAHASSHACVKHRASALADPSAWNARP